MTIFGRAGARLYADFLMPSRLGAYRDLLARCLDAGYAFLSVEGLWARRGDKAALDTSPVVVLRHDVDTDPGTAAAMWAIERELGILGSYFFRLSTLDISLMTEIAATGGHASYHYEEIATLAKRGRLRTRAAVERRIGEARAEFLRNITELRAVTGLPMSVVASHGDFVNRHLGMPNWELLADEDFRRRAAVELETYDAAAMRPVTSRHSDTLHPRYWLPTPPEAAILRRERVIYLLVHPRHWHVSRGTNARDDLGRLKESVMYAVPWERRRDRDGLP